MTSPSVPRVANHATESLPRWSTMVVVLAAALTGTGAAIAVLHPTLVTPPHTAMNAAARVYAGYTFSRDLALAAAFLGLLAVRARRGLSGLLVLFALIQIIDIGVDAANGRLALLPGLGALVLLLLSAVWQLTKPSTSLLRPRRQPRVATTATPG